MTGPQTGRRVVPLRWWHLPEASRLDAALFGAEAWTPELFWSELAAPGRIFLAVLAEDRVVGYGGLAVHGDEAYVHTLGVAAAQQGHGVGRALLRALLSGGQDAGAVRTLLEVRADDPVAQGLYRSEGFTELGRRRGYYQPSNTDAVTMDRRSPATRSSR